MLSNLLKKILRVPNQDDRIRRARVLFDAGMAQKDAGDYAGARRLLEEAIELDHRRAEAHLWLGVLLTREQSYAAAVRHLERALELDPRIEGAWSDLGTARYLHRDLGGAAAAFRSALTADPDSVVALANLGRVLSDSGHKEEGLEFLRRAYELAPDEAGTLRALVVALVDLDRVDEALSVAKHAAERKPGDYDAQMMLGHAYQKNHAPDRALDCYDAAYRVRTDDPEFYFNRGVALQDVGRLPEACVDYDRALAINPDYALAKFRRGLARLLLADFQRGWNDYEERRLSGDFPGRVGAFDQWDGSPLEGRTIMVCSEQGMGDEIMFSSMLPQLIGTAGHVIVECEPRLLRLFNRSFTGATVFPSTPDRKLPPGIGGRRIDFEIFAGSLPLFFRRRREDFPRHEGYLKADPERVQQWRERLSQLGPGPKVGISWTGGVRKTRQPARSIPLERWLPILTVPDARFVSLQYTAGAADEAAAYASKNKVQITHWQDAIDDYDETAALVCALDLVVSVCTSVIHLGGALGKRVWVMAPYSPEWRYGFSGEAMPWYPSVRIVRQPAYDQWEPVISRVAADLRQLSTVPA